MVEYVNTILLKQPSVRNSGRHAPRTSMAVQFMSDYDLIQFKVDDRLRYSNINKVYCRPVPMCLRVDLLLLILV